MALTQVTAQLGSGQTLLPLHLSTRFSNSALWAQGTNCSETSICLFQHCIHPAHITCLDSNTTATIDNHLWGVLGIGNVREAVQLALCFSWDAQRATSCADEPPHADYYYAQTPWIAFEKGFTFSHKIPLQFQFGILQPAASASSLIRLDTSTKFTWVGEDLFHSLKASLNSHCKSSMCPGFRSYADPAALACFRITKREISELPDLHFLLNADEYVVKSEAYLFPVKRWGEDSYCIGIFANKDAAHGAVVLGMNMLAGKRMVVDFARRELQLSMGNKIMSAGVETTNAAGFNWTLFLVWGAICLAVGFYLGHWFAQRWRVLPCYRRRAAVARKRRVASNRKVTFLFDNSNTVPPPAVAAADSKREDGEEEQALII